MTGPGGKRRAAGLVLGLALLLGAAVIVPAPATAAGKAGTASRASGFADAHAPNPTVPQGSLTADSCVGATFCMALGSAQDSNDNTVQLVEVWDGTSWSLITPPQAPAGDSAAFGAVSCLSATACTVVGSSTDASRVVHPLAAAWDGSSWSLQPVPDPTNGDTATLESVSCASMSACTAVGAEQDDDYNPTAFAAIWNGSAWSVPSLPLPSGGGDSDLKSTSCATALACTAVGYATDTSGDRSTLAERWNGSTWSMQSTPSLAADLSSLTGVSCSTPKTCMAVGFYYPGPDPQSLAETWNGSSWTVQSTPDPGTNFDQLTSISCTAATACTAVGNDDTSAGGTWATTWNGSAWTLQSTAAPGNGGRPSFSDVSCSSASACTAVGQSGFEDYPAVTLAEASNGSAWSTQTTIDIAGAETGALGGVSCRSASSCTAVGYETSSPSNYHNRALAESWNGKAWKIQATPTPAGAISNQLYAVACASGKQCMSVGSYQLPSNTARLLYPLAQLWTGKKWTLQTVPMPSGSDDSQFDGVSCPVSTTCVAVGSGIADDTFATHPFAEIWNGSSWALSQLAPVPSNGTNPSLDEISCASSTACMAIGFYADNTTYAEVPFAQEWDGRTWTTLPIPTPEGAAGTLLNAVSCVAPTACTAVGEAFASGSESTVAERWDGTAWTVQSLPAPTGNERAELDGISCTSATSCTAVGVHATVIDEDDDGPSMGLAESWNGTAWSFQNTAQPATNTELRAVSCHAATVCLAVGNGVADDAYRATALAEVERH